MQVTSPRRLPKMLREVKPISPEERGPSPPRPAPSRAPAAPPVQHAPDHLRGQLAPVPGLGARTRPMVREDHGLAVLVQAEAQRGAQDAAEPLQEVGAGAQQLLGRQQHGEHQHAAGQQGGHLTRTVQPVPAALLRVAALVTAAISKVVCTVLLVHGTGGRERGVRSESSNTPAHAPERTQTPETQGVQTVRAERARMYPTGVRPSANPAVPSSVTSSK